MEPDKEFIFTTACFIILIEVKLLQQLKDWFVRPMERKKILCSLLSVKNSFTSLEIMITNEYENDKTLIVQTRWRLIE